MPPHLSGGFLNTGTLMADAIYNVTLDTSALTAAPGAYSLYFQLTDGSGTNDGNNTVTLSNFSFGGGAPVDPAQLFGGVSGTLSTGVTLTDNSFFNGFVQGFTPGSTLTFGMDLTTNVDAGGVPDLFAASILDANGNEIPSLDPSGADTLLTINIGSPLTVQPFAADPTTDPTTATSTGQYVTMGAPALGSPASVPEPSALLLVGAALVVGLAVRLRGLN
jgi:hypothetical protein